MQYQNDPLSIHVGPECQAVHPALGSALPETLHITAPVARGTPSDSSHASALADAKRAADQEIERLQARVQALAAELVAVREAERARLARELHDDVGAHLSATHFALARIETWLPESAPPACAEALELANRTLQQACEASHRVVAGLHAPQLDAGVSAALAESTADFAARTQVPARFAGSADPRFARLVPEASAALFRLAQEALNNIAKHAGATQVDISLEAERRHATLIIKDNGRGLSRQARAGAPRFGLGGMRARCEAFGGTLKITSQAGAGTTIRARLPWAALLGAATSPRQA